MKVLVYEERHWCSAVCTLGAGADGRRHTSKGCAKHAFFTSLRKRKEKQRYRMSHAYHQYCINARFPSQLVKCSSKQVQMCNARAQLPRRYYPTSPRRSTHQSHMHVSPALLPARLVHLVCEPTCLACLAPTNLHLAPSLVDSLHLLAHRY